MLTIIIFRQEIATESKVRYESIEDLKINKCMQNGFPKLHEEFKGDTQALDEVDNEIMANINSKQNEFDDQLDEQRASLTETEKAMNEIINDMVGNIQKEIDAERKVSSISLTNLLIIGS